MFTKHLKNQLKIILPLAILGALSVGCATESGSNEIIPGADGKAYVPGMAVRAASIPSSGNSTPAGSVNASVTKAIMGRYTSCSLPIMGDVSGVNWAYQSADGDTTDQTLLIPPDLVSSSCTIQIDAFKASYTGNNGSQIYVYYIPDTSYNSTAYPAAQDMKLTLATNSTSTESYRFCIASNQDDPRAAGNSCDTSNVYKDSLSNASGVTFDNYYYATLKELVTDITTDLGKFNVLDFNLIYTTDASSAATTASGNQIKAIGVSQNALVYAPNYVPTSNFSILDGAGWIWPYTKGGTTYPTGNLTLNCSSCTNTPSEKAKQGAEYYAVFPITSLSTIVSTCGASGPTLSELQAIFPASKSSGSTFFQPAGSYPTLVKLAKCSGFFGSAAASAATNNTNAPSSTSVMTQIDIPLSSLITPLNNTLINSYPSNCGSSTPASCFYTNVGTQTAALTTTPSFSSNGASGASMTYQTATYIPNGTSWPSSNGLVYYVILMHVGTSGSTEIGDYQKIPSFQVISAQITAN